jgi:hypothetical protein
LLLACVPLAAAAPAPSDEARAVLEKALKAQGGADKLSKFGAVTFKGKGSVKEGDQEVSFTMDGAAQGFDRLRLDVEASFSGRTERALIVINKNKGWARARDKTEDAPPQVLEVLTIDIYALALATRPAQMLDKEFTLSHLGELKLDGRTTVGLRVGHKDRPDVEMYSDKETGLLARIKFQGKAFEGGQEAPHAFAFSDYKETDGVKQFTKVAFEYQDKQLFTLELSEFKGEAKLDDSLFEKP